MIFQDWAVFASVMIVGTFVVVGLFETRPKPKGKGIDMTATEIQKRWEELFKK